MTKKNRVVFSRAACLLLALGTFVYGVGVGNFRWPPYDVLRAIYQTVAQTDFKGATQPHADALLRGAPSTHITEVILRNAGMYDAPRSHLSPGTRPVADLHEYWTKQELYRGLSHLVATWENKYLAYYDETLVLYEIHDGVLSFRQLPVPGVEQIEYAFIFASGNILFCSKDTAYYSDDKMKSFNKSQVFDVMGKPYNPGSYGNFFTLVVDRRQFIGDREIRVWGNYVNYGEWVPGSSRSASVQVWYTVDEGMTLRQAYKFSNKQGGTEALARHVHAVNMSPWDETFWVQTGDAKNECHWMQGTYELETDSWQWRIVATGDEMSHYKSTGFVWYGDNVYWANDSSDPGKQGIWKTPYANLVTSSVAEKLFEQVLSTGKEVVSLVGNSSGIMVASVYMRDADGNYQLYSTRDGGVTWANKKTHRMIINIHPPNAHGEILGNYYSNQYSVFERIHLWDWSPALFLNWYLDL